jgi:hypothetical protein
MVDSPVRNVFGAILRLQFVVSFGKALLNSVVFSLAPSFIRKAKGKQGLLFLYLIQDIDLLASASQEFLRQNLPHITYVDRQLIIKHPHIFLLLCKHQMPYFFSLAPRKKLSLLHRIEGFSFVLTAVETSWGPHAPAHQIVREANKLGIPTYTCQHGYENIGLTFDEIQHPIEETHVSSKKIFIWSSKELLHPRIPNETRDKCIETGFLKSLEFDSALKERLPSSFPIRIGIFENLHWERFTQEYRDNFISNLTDMIFQFPQIYFVLKPHPAGQWLTKNKIQSFVGQKNVLILPNQGISWSLFTTIDWIGNLDAVITTPSTVALDGALIGKPIGIVSDEQLDLAAYQPLQMLKTKQDWIDYIGEVLTNRTRLLKLSDTFVRKNCVGNNGWSKASQYIQTRLERDETPSSV